MRRVGSVIGLDSDGIEEYERLHTDVWPAVLQQIAVSNIRNYSIFRDATVLFSYFEYVGDDYEADMAAIAADAETQRWWALCMPLQRPFDDRADGEWWKTLPEVFHVD